MILQGKLILAIEAAVRGGSIALIQNGCEIARWHGSEDVSRAEDLLANVSSIFDRARIDKRDLNFIAVSNGPGSYTGIRIGLATALGLARAMNIECVGVPLLRALADAYSGGSNCVAVIPIGRSELCWQAFSQSDAAEPPRTGSATDLLVYLAGHEGCKLILQQDAFEAIGREPGFDVFRSTAYDCGRDLALAVGIDVRNRDSDLTPNYVRNPQFSSDPV